MNLSSLQQTTPTSPFHSPFNFFRSQHLRVEPCTAPFISVLNEFASTAFSRLYTRVICS
ncbi:hypothetical protein CY34DRAFT_211949 [Suillus luteus UH-Slu-Lm8-n1]|uniref:Uncharacterized protein n=1 Tax=Suillus luteus UH-Slu-Lm8-n1 TaxID=930992 RepID=A0A0D0BPG3_9AGAM|nr:hypothetical protein CY34DRAFT_211949 [Suillus luteus UH-Slu-Lm8-n1]